MKAIEAPARYEAECPYGSISYRDVLCYGCEPLDSVNIQATEEGVMQHVRETGHDAIIRRVEQRLYVPLRTQ